MTIASEPINLLLLAMQVLLQKHLTMADKLFKRLQAPIDAQAVGSVCLNCK